MCQTAAVTTGGGFYGRFLASGDYTPAIRECVETTVGHLVSEVTSEERPGMLLGKIQSGKTRTFLGIIALAFDNGFDQCIILTKGTNALTEQTVKRVAAVFREEIEADRAQVFDVMVVPELTRYLIQQKIILICKKEDDNLRRLEALLFADHPELGQKRTLIVDDEADFGGVSMRREKGGLIKAGTLWGQIDGIREQLRSYAVLQVTATPYSLYLQPDEAVTPDRVFRPVRPAFTVLVPVHDQYVGGDFYFRECDDETSVASLLHRSVSEEEMVRLEKVDRRRVRTEDILTTTTVSEYRNALITFLVGAAIRRLQQEAEQVRREKYSFLIHIKVHKDAHQWQREILEALLTALRTPAQRVRAEELIAESYRDLAQSVGLAHLQLPGRESVIAECFRLLDGLGINLVNSENDVNRLLNPQTGQLELRNPANVFIGGFILDRGLTIANVIGFFYGRSPKTFQQDTVLQHARMYGARPLADLMVTRYYTTPRIYQVMRSIHEMDSDLREALSRGGNDAGVVFVQRDVQGRVLPCSPNKVLLSDIVMLHGHKRLVPYGFQTGYASRIGGTVEQLDGVLAGRDGEPSLMALTDAERVIRLIRQTLCFCRNDFAGQVPGPERFEDEGFSWDVESFVASMRYAAGECPDEGRRDRVWCLVRTNRDRSRRRSGGRYENAPYTGEAEGALAAATATDLPLLMLLRQNGGEDKGWMGTPFWWPVLWMPGEMKPVVFSPRTAVAGADGDGA